jgi:hypothetical protein
MTQNRSSSKHRRRRIARLLLSVAILAIAFSLGRDGYRHVDTGSPRIEMALGGGHGGGGGFGHWRAKSGAGGAAGSQNGTIGGQHQAYGPGEGDDRSDWGGYMPNGEDGLMALADFVHGHDGGNNPNQGTEHGWDGKPGGGPGGDPSSQVGSGGPQGGGYTGGGGGGFGGGGGGGPGGNGGNGGNGGDGGGGPATGDPGFHVPGDGNNDGVGGKGCVVDCSQSPGDGWHPPGGPGEGGPHNDAPLNSAVPEPALWMMLILGFGVIGAALRVQRRKGPQLLA